MAPLGWAARPWWDGLGPGLRIRPHNDLPRPSQSGRHLEVDEETSFFLFHLSSRVDIRSTSFTTSIHTIRPVIRPLRLRVHHHCRSLCCFGVSGCRAEYARRQRDHSRKSKRGRCLPRRGALAQRGGRPPRRPPPDQQPARGSPDGSPLSFSSTFERNTKHRHLLGHLACAPSPSRSSIPEPHLNP